MSANTRSEAMIPLDFRAMDLWMDRRSQQFANAFPAGRYCCQGDPTLIFKARNAKCEERDETQTANAATISKSFRKSNFASARRCEAAIKSLSDVKSFEMALFYSWRALEILWRYVPCKGAGPLDCRHHTVRLRHVQRSCRGRRIPLQADDWTAQHRGDWRIAHEHHSVPSTD